MSKMLKKALMVHWLFLLFALILSIGTLMYFGSNKADAIYIGEFALKAGKAIEEKSGLHLITDKVTEEINKWTLNNFNNPPNQHPVFTWKSYCEDPPDTDTAYKDSLAGKQFVYTLATGDTPSKTANINCIIGENDLGTFYWEIFRKKYNEFSQVGINNLNLDFANLDYDFSVEKVDNKFFIKGTTTGLTEPIAVRIEGKENQGSLNIDDISFRLAVNYPFDVDPGVCLLSKGCGATCDDVISWYQTVKAPSDPTYNKKESGCATYSDCDIANDAEDDFSQAYPCTEDGANRNLCQGSCVEYCSTIKIVGLETVDIDTATICKQYSCTDYFTCSDVTTCACSDDPNECTGACLPYCKPTSGKIDDAADNTNCLVNSCDSYVTSTCTDAVSCGCETNNACAGACLPYCYTANAGKVDDGDPATLCTNNICSNYFDCQRACGDPSDCSNTLTCSCDEGSDRACKGSCLQFCKDDGDSNTNCQQKTCDKYTPCSTVSTCGCSSGNACTGTCTILCSEDGLETTKCMTNSCGSYVDCLGISSCACASGNACSGDCTEPPPEPQPIII